MISHLIGETFWNTSPSTGAAPPDTRITNATYCNNLVSYCDTVTSCNNLAKYCNNITHSENLASYCNNVLWQWSHILLEKRFKTHQGIPWAAPPDPRTAKVTYCNDLVSSCMNMTSCNNLTRYLKNITCCNDLASYCNNVLWQWSHILLETRFKIHHRLPGTAPPDPRITNVTYCNNNLASYYNNVLWQWSHILLEKRFKIHHRLPGAATPGSQHY